MAGILDVISRVMDTLVTSEGRRQIASGRLKIEYASFTDRQLFYASGSSGYLEDPGTRIYFEAYSDNNDKIIIETDAEGQLEPFSSDSYTSYGGTFYASGSALQTGSIDMISEEITENAILSFQRQMIIGSRELYLVDKGSTFKAIPDVAEFFITDNSPFAKGSVTNASLNDIESVFQDFRLGNMLNFRFLPPISRPLPGNVTGSVIADYTRINQDTLDTWEEVEEMLEGKDYQEVNFEETSEMNNIIGQIFEQSGNSLEKLAVIDLGSFSREGYIYPHLLFAGKLFRDSKGCLTFVNIFTLLFEQ